MITGVVQMHKLSKIITIFFFLLFSQVLRADLNSVSMTLNERQICDLELIMDGGFHPLEGFMDEETYNRVIHEMRLLDGSLWPIPIVLDLPEELKETVDVGSKLYLRDSEGVILAKMTISSLWKANKIVEAEKVYATTNPEHPGVSFLLYNTGAYYAGGQIERISTPQHADFQSLRKTPEELKAFFQQEGFTNIVGFQTRNPLHRAHIELMMLAAQESNAHILLHPAVGMTKPGDIDYFTRVKCYKNVLKYCPKDSITLSLLPLAMRMAGPREALWHALIRKNYGCTHFIIGRDHAGPGKDSSGKDFYPPYAAQELVQAYAEEIGMEVLPFKEMVYVKEDDNYQQIDNIKPGKTILSISGTQIRQMLENGVDIPSWFSYPDIIKELKKMYPARHEKGMTIFFTGLSGSGKSTIAKALNARLMEIQSRPITVLDGDIVRKNLSSELGFSKEHRALNVRRVGFVAQEITKNRGIAICALIAPYEADRLYNRNIINACGSYIEIYMATPLETCEQRDVKGLYCLARQGKLQGFTGINDPYEEPPNPEIIIDTTEHSINKSVDIIINFLERNGYLSA